MSVNSWVKFGFFCVFCCFYSQSLAGKSHVLGDENWGRMLEGEWLVKFFAPWCPACQNLAPTWSTLALKAEQLGINVGEVDSSKEGGLSGRFMVVSLPTIYHIKDGEFRKFEGPRSLDGLMDFINEQKWRNVDPIPWWRSPGSYLMGCFSLMFKFSMLLKDLHELLTVTYGLPVWASYTIFGVTTVLTGLLLGAGIVFVTDFVFGAPPTQSYKASVPPCKEEPENDPDKEKNEGDDEKEEEHKAKDETAEKQGHENDESGIRRRVVASADK